MNDNAPIFFDIEQRSDEWFRLHLGRPSASQFHRVVSDKGRPLPKTAQTYKWQLLAERIFQVPFGPKLDRIPAVRHGIKYEDPAREQLEKRIGPIRPGGLVMTRDKLLVASPDGFVGDIPIEIKCPLIPGQLENLLIEPRDYWPQLQGQMMVTGQDWLHFWSWHPCTPAQHFEVQRDFVFCNTLNFELRQFCADLDRTEERLRALGEYNVELYREMIKPKEESENETSRGTQDHPDAG